MLLAPAAATAWPTLAVTGVPKNDVLNLRAQPDAKSAKVASVPRNATGISADAVAVKGLDWIRISHSGRSGWANARFLSYEDGGLPVRLSCSGTEPFWSVEVGFGRADADLAYSDRRQTLALDAPLAARGRPGLWSLPALKGGDFLLVERASCSDGMSDRNYPFKLSARIGKDLLSGCCR
jgi:hypothetical protein